VRKRVRSRLQHTDEMWTNERCRIPTQAARMCAVASSPYVWIIVGSYGCLQCGRGIDLKSAATTPRACSGRLKGCQGDLLLLERWFSITQASQRSSPLTTALDQGKHVAATGLHGVLPPKCISSSEFLQIDACQYNADLRLSRKSGACHQVC